MNLVGNLPIVGFTLFAAGTTSTTISVETQIVGITAAACLVILTLYVDRGLCESRSGGKSMDRIELRAEVGRNVVRLHSAMW